MRKAYIIIAHKNPEQLYRLVSRLIDGRSNFFIHIDKKADINQFKNLNEFKGILYFLDRFDSKWGRLGTIDPFMHALQTIADHHGKFDRILLLSGQDYPIKSNKQIDAFFQTSQHSVFLNYFPIPNHSKWPGSDRGGLYRVDKYYFGAVWYELLASKTLNMIARFFPFLRRKIPNGMKPFTGQTWWNLDSYTANYVLNYHRQHPEYKKFHKHTFVADELYVQMIVGNTTDQRILNSIENNEKRFTIWKDVRDAHPKTLTVADFTAIVSSDDLFARKFDDQQDSEILDLIDRWLLF